MVQIRNISGFDVRIPRIGEVTSGGVIDVPSEIAELLVKNSPKQFEKATAKGKSKVGGKE